MLDLPDPTVPLENLERSERERIILFSEFSPSIVSAGEGRSHHGRFRPEPVVHPGESPVEGDVVRTLHQFLN